MTEVCVKSGFPLIAVSESDQVICISEVQFAEHGGPLKEFECR